MTGKEHALLRLSSALKHVTLLNGFDQEEIDHLNEVYRIIDEDVPAEYFDGFEDFRPARTDTQQTEGAKR